MDKDNTAFYSAARGVALLIITEDIPSAIDEIDCTYVASRHPRSSESDYCKNFKIRAMCPISCGCRDAFSYYYRLDGCTQACADPRRGSTLKEIQSTSRNCNDMDVSQLAANATWLSYMEDYASTLSTKALIDDALEALNTSYTATNETNEQQKKELFLNTALSLGCDTVRNLTTVVKVSENLCDASDVLDYIRDASSWCPEACLGKNCGFPTPPPTPPPSQPFDAAVNQSGPSPPGPSPSQAVGTNATSR